MIAEVLYYIFIYPMQTLLGVVFEWIYAHTHSYGWAIVLLSVAINLFLLKLTNLADKKAQKTNLEYHSFLYYLLINTYV